MSSDEIAPSPLWRRTMPPGPDTRMKITEGYAKLVGTDVYFWAWPLAGVYNRRLAAAANTEIAHAGPVPSAPLNRLAMLTDYVAPEERIVACPNQDVVYGGGSLALEQSPVVMQVPDFGDRFWVYQVADTRTDSFVQLGAMYATTPGSYLLGVRTGPAMSPAVLQKCSARRPIPALRLRGFSLMTRRRIGRRFSRCCSPFSCTRCPSTTAR